MKLTVMERLLVPRLLPTKGSITNQTLVRDINNKVSFSGKEKKKFDLVTTPQGGLKWDEKKAKAKEIEFTFSEVQLLKDAVKEKDKKKEITPQILDLSLKIKDYEYKKPSSRK